MEINTSDVLATLSFGDKVFNLKLGAYVIGNSAGQYDIGFEDASVDLKHAALNVTLKSTQIMDLFSKHGTYIDGKKFGVMEIIDLQKTASLQFGSVVCQYHSHHENDSGFLGLSHSSIRDTSIIPSTPVTNQYESKISRQRLQDNTRKSTTSTPSLLVAQSFSESAIESDDMFGNITNVSVRAQCSALDVDDDDNIIPETQEAFTQPHSDSSDFLQLNTQDFNDINEESTDSDNVIAEFCFAESMHIPYIKPPHLEEVQNSGALKETPKNIFKSVDHNNDSGDETDSEELILKWNASTISDKCNGEICKSTSVTPDIDFSDGKQAESDDEICLDPTQAFILPKPSTSDECLTKQGEVCTDPTHAFLVPKTSASSECLIKKSEICSDTAHGFILPKLSDECLIAENKKKDEKDLDPSQAFTSPKADTKDECLPILSTNDEILIQEIEEDNEIDLEPTQAFILPKASTSHERLNGETEENLNLRPVQPKIENVNQTENLVETQVFVFRPPCQPSTNTNRSISIPSVDHINKIKSISAKDFKVPEKDDADVAPLQTLKPPNDQSNTAIFSLLDNDEKDESLEATQIFNFTKPSRPVATHSPVLLESDEEENNSEYCIFETLVIGEEPNSERSGNNEESHGNKKLINKLFGSSDEEEDDVVNLNTSEMNKHSMTPAAIKLQIQATPDFAFKLPNLNKINAADEIFQKASKKRKPHKTLLQESSDDDDDIDPIKLMDRLLNETSKSSKHTTVKPAKKISEKSKKPIISKHTVCKTATISSISANLKKDDSGRKTRSTKSPATSVTTRASSRIKTLPGYLIDFAIDDKTILTKELLAKENSVERKKRHHQQQQKQPNDNIPDDQSMNTSHDKRIIDKTEPVEKRLAKKRRSQANKKDENVIAKKRSKENVPAIEKPVSSEESPVIRKSSRQLKPRIVFTKLDSKPYTKLVEKIGACIVENPADCNVLITDTIYRTWKFMAALAKGIPIVSAKWLHDAAADINAEMAYDDYLIKDTIAERRFKFTLRKSLDRARKSPIFKGYSFYCTPNTKPTPSELCTIIECAGGNVIKRIPKDFQKPENFYVISDKADISTWLRLREAIRDVTIISTEGILLAVIQQYITFKSFLLS